MGAMTPGEQRARRADARARGQADPSLIPHGSSSGYCFWGCRCGICKRAQAKRDAVAYRRRVARAVAVLAAGRSGPASGPLS